MNHHCQAPGCKIGLPSSLAFCRAHWALVPKDIQTRLLTAFRLRQRMPHVIASADAIDAVAKVLCMREYANRWREMLNRQDGVTT